MTTTVGSEATVEILSGYIDCVFAEDLLNTYYDDPLTPPRSS